MKSGYAATRLEDVAARAGVTKGTIYFYFDTKERVFDEMIRYKSQSFFPKVQDYASGLQGSCAERLRSMIVFVHKYIAEDRSSRETLRFLIAEGSRFPGLVDRHYDEFIRPMIERFEELIADGIAAGEFRPFPAMAFTELMLSPGLFLSFWSLLFGSRRPIDVEAFTEASIDLLMQGIVQPALQHDRG